MPVEVTMRRDDTIQVREMRDGQIAVITSWYTSDTWSGIAVQRTGVDLIGVGTSCVEVANLFGHDFCGYRDECCRVRVLPNGTKLTIRGNE